MNRYYLFLNNAADGPWDADRILEKVKNGEIGRDCLVGVEGGADWAPVHEVFPELADSVTAVPAPGTPPMFRKAPSPTPRLSPTPPVNPYAPPTPGFRSEPVPLGMNMDAPLIMDGTIIPGTEGLTAGEVVELIKAGGRFAVWQYNFSILVMSFRRSSGIRFISPGEGGFAACFGYSCISAFVGWWGFPWGIFWTPMTLGRNLLGGLDLTEPILAGIVGPSMADHIIKNRPTSFKWQPLLAVLLAFGLAFILLFSGLIQSILKGDSRRSSRYRSSSRYSQNLQVSKEYASCLLRKTP